MDRGAHSTRSGPVFESPRSPAVQCFMATVSTAAPMAAFPYVYSEETVRPRYWRFRAEGRTLLRSLCNVLSYYRKYHDPKTSAPAQEVRYFDHQRQMLRLLAGRSPPPSSTRIAMVGDIMWLHRAEQSFLEPSLLEYLNRFDVVLGNLETVISHRFPVPFFLPDWFTHNSSPALVTSFRRGDGRNTFTALATANNHSLDHGDPGLFDTLAFLDSQGILHSGVRRNSNERPYVTFTAGGIRFGFYAACWGLNNAWIGERSRLHISVLPGLAPTTKQPVDLSGVRQALAGMAEEKVDVKIVYLHWGYEFEFYPCPQLMQVGRDIVRAGADIIFGSHPHVAQPIEFCFLNGYEQRYRAAGIDHPSLRSQTGCVIDDGTGVPRQALIAYSLGNFTTSLAFLHTQIGMLLGLHFYRDETGRVDWAAPKVDFVYNIRRHPLHRKRRLVLLDRFVQERQSAGDDCAALQAAIAFLHKHVWG